MPTAKIPRGAEAASLRGSAWPAISCRTVRSTSRLRTHLPGAITMTLSPVAAREAKPGCSTILMGSLALPASHDILEMRDAGCAVSHVRTFSSNRSGASIAASVAHEAARASALARSAAASSVFGMKRSFARVAIRGVPTESMIDASRQSSRARAA